MKNLQSTFSSLMLLGLKTIRPELTEKKPGHRFASRVFCPGYLLVKLGPTSPCNRCALTGRLYICHRILENRYVTETKTA
jgi:hypothetical protein